MDGGFRNRAGRIRRRHALTNETTLSEIRQLDPVIRFLTTFVVNRRSK
ncbi:hypothetical protein SCATT_02490 [Streptantibioticus cattleyicolor NRRL 8057 = DSM 46488]|uniref:Uncharacterized protein n=1 Tax=Streptantibioticus cattleyicolor (strain ATCC 35852 / DSM 46488 / JCM 4925 / NBRC 14057 / NRRL 8057) TaxID=1003195 RepID=G8WMQ2_STREN|nr:hypothetical protein SCATT_02490 [Streptantibioticus cattleyicolor NRRL 8057 = DSM 46488]